MLRHLLDIKEDEEKGKADSDAKAADEADGERAIVNLVCACVCARVVRMECTVLLTNLSGDRFVRATWMPRSILPTTSSCSARSTPPCETRGKRAGWLALTGRLASVQTSASHRSDKESRLPQRPAGWRCGEEVPIAV